MTFLFRKGSKVCFPEYLNEVPFPNLPSMLLRELIDFFLVDVFHAREANHIKTLQSMCGYALDKQRICTLFSIAASSSSSERCVT